LICIEYRPEDTHGWTTVALQPVGVLSLKPGTHVQSCDAALNGHAVLRRAS
jgi:hypothetical protein